MSLKIKGEKCKIFQIKSKQNGVKFIKAYCFLGSEILNLDLIKMGNISGTSAFWKSDFLSHNFYPFFSSVSKSAKYLC